MTNWSTSIASMLISQMQLVLQFMNSFFLPLGKVLSVSTQYLQPMWCVAYSSKHLIGPDRFWYICCNVQTSLLKAGHVSEC